MVIIPERTGSHRSLVGTCQSLVLGLPSTAIQDIVMPDDYGDEDEPQLPRVQDLIPDSTSILERHRKCAVSRIQQFSLFSSPVL